jgi:hypothetical protein
MCIQCEPENDHSCCRLSADLIEYLADQQHLTIPKLRAHKVAHHLYAVWKEDDAGTAHCIEACCTVNAKNEYTSLYIVIDKAEIELNRMYALDDPRERDECRRIFGPDPFAYRDYAWRGALHRALDRHYKEHPEVKDVHELLIIA